METNTRHVAGGLVLVAVVMLASATGSVRSHAAPPEAYAAAGAGLEWLGQIGGDTLTVEAEGRFSPHAVNQAAPPQLYLPLALRDGAPDVNVPTAVPPTPTTTAAITGTATATATVTATATITVTVPPTITATATMTATAGVTPTEPGATASSTPTGTPTATAPNGVTPTPTSTLGITSPEFNDGETIPVRHTCDGDDVSPELQWAGVPAGTQSFALIVDDPDAPGGTFDHWVRYDVPGNRPGLPEGDRRTGLDGRNEFGVMGYRGPCPPPGRPHLYFFRLFALDLPSLGLPQGVSRQDVEQAMAGHILARATLSGRYGRQE